MTAEERAEFAALERKFAEADYTGWTLLCVQYWYQNHGPCVDQYVFKTADEATASAVKIKAFEGQTIPNGRGSEDEVHNVQTSITSDAVQISRFVRANGLSLTGEDILEWVNE